MSKGKITTLTNEYTKEIKKYEHKKIRYKHFSRRRIAGLAIISVILFTFPAIDIVKSYSTLVKANTNLHQIQEKSKQVDDDVAANKRKVKQLDDDDYVAKVARDKFYYSKDGEQIYRLPEASKSK
ncbi:MAG: septum formation initiator family protein [Streptococcaceae bacterium]|nr:septum formation initiator family protein [Streptococcaceae bacterium]